MEPSWAISSFAADMLVISSICDLHETSNRIYSNPVLEQVVATLLFVSFLGVTSVGSFFKLGLYQILHGFSWNSDEN